MRCVSSMDRPRFWRDSRYSPCSATCLSLREKISLISLNQVNFHVSYIVFTLELSSKLLLIQFLKFSGVGLAFLAYPEVASNLPVMRQFFAFLFFLMITILGLDSQVSWLKIQKIRKFLDLHGRRSVHCNRGSVSDFTKA